MRPFTECAHTHMMQPFLALPFREGTSLSVSEGWLYSSTERAVHGHAVHYGVDFAAERRTPVYAAVGGWAVASYHTALAGTQHRGKPVGYGLGNFVQVWNPARDLCFCYAHLERAAPRLPYLAPVRHAGAWRPEAVTVPPDRLVSRAVCVRRGDLVGYVGDSGLSWGYEEAPRSPRDPGRFPSWDEVHLHFEVYRRDRATGGKAERFDPFCVYGTAEQYALTGGPGTLWLAESDGTIRFARR